MRIIDLGLTDFLEAYELQIDLLKKVSAGECEDTLLLTEHKPVVTIGRKGSRRNILKTKEYLSLCGIGVLDIDRGGDVTYHGPGQLVAYPIFKLKGEGRDIHGFLQFLEEAGKHFLFQYGITAQSRPSFRGIWVDDRKIASIGIAVKKWVTCHGMAININLDLAPFSFIRPCGIEGIRMVSLKELLCREIDFEDAKDKFKSSFKEVSVVAETVRCN